MPLHEQTSPVVIVGYEALTQDNGLPMVRKDGSPVEMCQFAVEGEVEPRSIVLDPAVNGNRAKVGAKVGLQVVSEQRQEAKVSTRTGRAYIANVTKRRVVGFSA